MRAKITARLLKGLKRKAKAYSISDTEVQGFTLRVLPSGTMSYCVLYRDASGRRQRYTIGPSTAWTVAQARDKATAVRSQVNLGEDPAADKRAGRVDTLGEFIEGRYAEWATANRKAGDLTVRQLTSAFAALLDKKLGAVTAWDVEKWRSARVKKAGSKSAGNRDIARLKAAMSKAVDWGLLTQNPLASVKLAKVDTQAEIRILTPEEEPRLFDALRAREDRARCARDSHNLWLRARGHGPMPDLKEVEYADHVRPIVTLLLHCGLRRGEAFGLSWADVNLDKAMLTVRGVKAKSGTTRRVPLNVVALDCLRKWRSQTRGDGLVFPSPLTGRQLDNINSAWRAVLKEAGIAGLTIHALRHTFATRALAAGADVETVRALLGHHSIAVTARYVHTSEDRKRAAVEAIVADGRSNVLPLREGVAQGDTQ